MSDGMLAAAGAAGLGLALRAYTNVFAVELHPVELAFESLPSSFDGFSILHLTDLHMRKWGRVEKRVASIIKNNPSDIVVFTGDLVTTPSGLEPFAALLDIAQASSGTYVVFGNTEHKYWDHKALVELFESHGAKVLMNSSAQIERAGESICIAGVDDPFTGHSSVHKALTGVPEDRFKILLAHAPVVADDAARFGVQLMLSGHTHGGQVRLPFVGALRTHLPRYRELVMGLFRGDHLNKVLGADAGDMNLYVSRGIGTSYAPLRLMCRPEIPRYILRKA